MTLGYLQVHPATKTPPTVASMFFRQMHLEMVNSIQAGRADQAYDYARLLVAIGATLQQRPAPHLVPVPKSCWVVFGFIALNLLATLVLMALRKGYLA